MYRVIEGILKKHLHEAAKRYEREVEMTIVSSMELLWGELTTEEWRELVQELTVAIRGVDLSTFHQIPSLEDTKNFLKGITPIDHIDDGWMEDYLEFHVPLLIKWMEGYVKAGLC